MVTKHRKEGREIVVVMGVGFVGAVMAGIVADAVQKPEIRGDDGPSRKNAKFQDLTSELAQIPTGQPNKFVIGMQRPSPRSYWKIPYLNRGIAPVEAEGLGRGHVKRIKDQVHGSGL